MNMFRNKHHLFLKAFILLIEKRCRRVIEKNIYLMCIFSRLWVLVHFIGEREGIYQLENWLSECRLNE